MNTVNVVVTVILISIFRLQKFQVCTRTTLDVKGCSSFPDFVVQPMQQRHIKLSKYTVKVIQKILAITSPTDFNVSSFLELVRLQNVSNGRMF